MKKCRCSSLLIIRWYAHAHSLIACMQMLDQPRFKTVQTCKNADALLIWENAGLNRILIMQIYLNWGVTDLWILYAFVNADWWWIDVDLHFVVCKWRIWTCRFWIIQSYAWGICRFVDSFICRIADLDLRGCKLMDLNVVLVNCICRSDLYLIKEEWKCYMKWRMQAIQKVFSDFRK